MVYFTCKVTIETLSLKVIKDVLYTHFPIVIHRCPKKTLIPQQTVSVNNSRPLWCGQRESNSRLLLGKEPSYH